MSRTLPTDYAALTEGAVFRPALLVELDWPSGMVRCWSGLGTISWGGEDYLGVGDLGAFTPIEESTDGRANGVALTLSGIPVANVANALANDAQGRAARLWIAALADDGTLAADPYLIFDGAIDTCTIEYGPETATISVNLEKELIDRRLQQRRYTHEDQQIEYPGDRFFEYVAGLQNKEIAWGGKVLPGVSATPGGVRDPNLEPWD